MSAADRDRALVAKFRNHTGRWPTSSELERIRRVEPSNTTFLGPAISANAAFAEPEESLAKFIEAAAMFTGASSGRVTAKAIDRDELQAAKAIAAIANKRRL